MTETQESRVPDTNPQDMDAFNEDWFRDAVEIDLRVAFNEKDEDWWTSGFLPPPPRPPYLEDVASDGLTTCDLCTWARHPYLGPEIAGGREISWVMTLIIVSFLSALIGAIVMITVIRCRNRLKHLGHTSGTCWCLGRDTEQEVPSIHMASRPSSRASSKAQESRCPLPDNDARRRRVWSWLARRNAAAPAQLGAPPPPVADNHYTMDEAYPPNEEALYAELDRESCNSPAYQNTGYSGSEMEQDCVPSSAPSSAYYSDLSCAPSDRTYEAVGPPDSSWDLRRIPPLRLTAIAESLSISPPNPNWDARRLRLSAIAETLSGVSTTTWDPRQIRNMRSPPRTDKTVPSDYV